VTAPLPRLPKLLAVALRAGGLEAVEKLVRAFGAKQLKVPHRCGDHHVLVAVAGRKVADAICDQAGGSVVEFPRGVRTMRRLALDELLDRDRPASLADIARALDVSRRHAVRLKVARNAEPAATPPVAATRKAANDPRQLDLEDYAKRK
jgi:hypothetical protein